MSHVHLNRLRRETVGYLDRHRPPDAARLSQGINAIDALLTEVEEAVVTSGLAAAQQGRLQDAEERLTLGLKIAELRDSDSLLATALIGMGLVYKRRSDHYRLKILTAKHWQLRTKSGTCHPNPRHWIISPIYMSRWAGPNKPSNIIEKL